mmetsp:Transcript_12878/g.14111  ORF Transcript_12878/g.14111 Transcript_12878/m.14111 type:complete len:377 (-) Transcript_12878:78-1208(-)
MKFVLVVHVVGLVLVSAVPDDFRFLNETNECNDPAIQPGTGICEPECYCIPDTEPCAVCPSLDNRVIAASPEGFQEAAFFQQLEVDNPNTLFTYDPPGCQPYPLVAQTLQIPVCEGLIQEETGKSSKSKSSKKSNDHYDDGPAQCSFNYKGKVCRTKRYNLVQDNKKTFTKNNKKSKSRSRTYVTHEGECGVCSTAQDLAVNLSPTLGRDAFQCSAGFSAALQTQDPTLIAPAFGALNDCFQQLGFTSNCAYIWASNGVHTTLVTGAAASALQQGLPPPPGIPQSCVLCAQTCLVDPTLPECLNPMKAGSCDLSNCFSCDEDASGPLFKKYSGRTRRNSGIITTFQNPEVPEFPFMGSKRSCSTIANVKQPSTTCN